MTLKFDRVRPRTFCFALVLLTLSQGAICQAAQPPQDGLLFYAPFDDSPNPTIGVPKALLDSKGEFPLVEGKTKQAIRTGAKNSFLLYDGSNINPAEGTVSLWLRPEWTQDTENFHLFWSLISDGRFQLYKHGSGTSLVFYIQGQGATEDQATVLQTSMADWKIGEWHHVAITWSAGNAQLFVDGTLEKELSNPNLVLPAIKPNTKFFVGDYYHPNYGTQSGLTGQGDSDIDELRIYNRTLDATEIRALAGKEGRGNVAMKPPQTAKVVVPKTTKPPKIDGTFSFDEWREAAGFSGFFDISNGKLTDKQTGVLLTYDDNNLYVATISALTGGTQLQSMVSARDGAVYTDDSIEIYLDPTKSRKSGQFVQFIGNYNGAILDVKDGDTNWSGNWNFKNGTTNFNGLGTMYWVAEIALPFKDIGRTTPQNGEEWTANFARSWVAGQQANTSWAWVLKSQYSTPERFGVLEFQDKAPAFQWTEIKDLITGQPTLSGTFKSVSPANLQISSVSSALPITEQALRADTQKAQPWTTTLDLASSSRDILRLEVRDKERALYSAELPYETETQPLRVFVSPIPTQNRLIVDVDPLQFRRKWAPGWKAEVRVETKASQLVATKSINAYAPPFARTEFDLRTLPIGDYNIVVRLRDASQKQIAEKTTAFNKPATPKWVGSQVGVTDKLLKPWTPLIVTPEALKLWGRQYSFGKNALPQQITSQQKPLLSAPLRLLVDGTPLSESADAKYSSKTEAKATRLGSSTAGGWKLDWTSEAAFDGVLWYEVKVTPPQGAKKTLQSLALEIPMRSDASTLYVTSAPGMSGESGATPAQWNSPWGQGLWLGNEKMGLSWFAESDQGWNLADPKKALTFLRDANQTLARINFVTKPLEVEKPITYRFGLLATPSRPLPIGWRGWQFSSRTSGTSINVDPEKPTHAISWWMNWSPLISAPYDVLPTPKKSPLPSIKRAARSFPTTLSPSLTIKRRISPTTATNGKSIRCEPSVAKPESISKAGWSARTAPTKTICSMLCAKTCETKNGTATTLTSTAAPCPIPTGFTVPVT